MAVDEAYTRSLRHKHVDFCHVTTLQSITHFLKKTHARITANDLKENDKNLHLSYDSTAPFENLIDRIENAVDFSSAGKSHCNLKQIATAAHNPMHETGVVELIEKNRGLCQMSTKHGTNSRIFSAKLIMICANHR